MNSYINAQIMQMVAMTKTFEHACELAAIKDDGKLSRDEEKMLKKIKTASLKFRKELESV